MARPLRLEHHGAIWHIHNRGVARGDIFRDDDDRLTFLATLAEAVRRFRWVIHQYALMTNHFHILLETPEPTLSRGMKWLAGKYAQRFNRRHDRVGPLFQGRFKSHLVEKETYLLELMRYIALNPVRAGLVERAEDYRWSSHRATAGYEPMPPWVASEWTMAQFGPDRQAQQREYQRFVDAGIGIERAPWEDAVGQFLIGSEAWVEQMRLRIEAKPRSNDHPSEQRFAGRPRPAKVVEVVAEVFGSSIDEVRSGHGTLERRAVCWLGCYESMARLGAIGTVLRLRSTSRVSCLIAECDRELERDPLLRIAIDRCIDLLRINLVRVPIVHRESYPGTALHA
jgi:putative transposase